MAIAIEDRAGRTGIRYRPDLLEFESETGQIYSGAPDGAGAEVYVPQGMPAGERVTAVRFWGLSVTCGRDGGEDFIALPALEEGQRRALDIPFVVEGVPFRLTQMYRRGEEVTVQFQQELFEGGELKEACAADLTGQKAAFQALFDGGPLSSEELFPWRCTLFERDRGSATFPAQGE